MVPLHVERRLIDIHADAISFYRAQLLEEPGSGPRAYLRSRGVPHVLDEDSIWRVGYAPAGWRTLTEHLRSRAYTDTELVQAGVSSVCRRGTLIDRFRDRIVVPIYDLAGAPVAFTARAAPGTGADIPKYLNTPTTPVYRKSENLLGLHEQRALLETGGRPVIVEGAFDVLAVARLNNRQWIPVSACGTHVTSEQLAVLAAATTLDSDLVLGFDADTAGRRASRRVTQYAIPWRGNITSLWSPHGTDPAELASRGVLGMTTTADTSAEVPRRTEPSTPRRVSDVGQAGLTGRCRPGDVTRGPARSTVRAPDSPYVDRRSNHVT